jgi:hypothetical protein
MDTKIRFTFAELNALNKLLGQIKSESHLTADELNFFSLSPHIISSFEKIHKEYMNHIRGQIESGQLKMQETQHIFKPENDFLLNEKHYTDDYEARIRNLGQENKDYIKQMGKTEREDYCDLIFAPFKPTESQRKKIIDILESITKK